MFVIQMLFLLVLVVQVSFGYLLSWLRDRFSLNLELGGALTGLLMEFDGFLEVLLGSNSLNFGLLGYG